MNIAPSTGQIACERGRLREGDACPRERTADGEQDRHAHREAQRKACDADQGAADADQQAHARGADGRLEAALLEAEHPGGHTERECGEEGQAEAQRERVMDDEAGEHRPHQLLEGARLDVVGADQVDDQRDLGHDAQEGEPPKRAEHAALRRFRTRCGCR